MTLISWLVVLGLIAFFAILVLRLVPNYLEYFKVESTLESLKNEPGITQKSPGEIRTLISRRFDINDVEHVKAKEVKITRDRGRTIVSVKYEVRVPVLGNVDAVTKFDKSVEIVHR
ncbi:DUF4845 domain-containing protein [Thiohalobacter sp.]|uniref:DUF4845 domain-containing protein n=1 Tax=Thiohalobacter sp. TaxID=2025948 RepID=UPI00260B3E26|nr:DUF4845 domain-containing protein [Thiohalobacter sp.]